MKRQISRRGFLTTAGIGTAATAVLTGCGPASRYLVREPYTRMPEYTYNGFSTNYATTCRECPAGCGIVVRTEQGRALKVEGNPDHPVNQGKTCARGQVALQGLYNPDRIREPLKLNPDGTRDSITWDEAITVIQSILGSAKPDGVAFLLGMVPDHLFDLVNELCTALGAAPPIRYGTYGAFDTRLTLTKAVEQLFSGNTLPYFDLAGADVTFSFGANYLETYLSPVAYSRGFAHMRRGKTGRRGYMVQFEPRMSQTAAVADEWFALAPGSEGLVALAIGRLVAGLRGESVPNAFSQADLVSTVYASGISETDLRRLASIFSEAEHPLAIPGGLALGQSNGLETAQSVLALNALVGNLGMPGGVYLSPLPLVNPQFPQQPNSLLEVNDLIGRMNNGEIAALLVHGMNPVFELPVSLGFAPALNKVAQIISFSSFPDETSQQADYIFPDHTALESWGYQRVATGSDRPAISGSQPVVTPFYNTKATADVLLAGVQAIGGTLAQSVPYTDEVDYMKNSLLPLVTEQGIYNAVDINAFMARFQQFGGWWSAGPGPGIPDGSAALSQPVNPATPRYDGTGEFYLFPYLSPILGDGSGANKPWLQEIPDPATTVMWNSWVEINPETADSLGIKDDDVVRIISPVGELEAVVYRYPAISPNTIAIPIGQGHAAYGRYAQRRGANPIVLLSSIFNGADDFAFGATKVRLEKTGRRKPLSRLESRLGVYGE